MAQFFVNNEYNKGKRKKAIILFIVLMIALFFTTIVFLVNGKMMPVFLIVIVGLMACLFFPPIVKSYPITDKPMWDIGTKEVSFGLNYKLKLTDIISVDVRVDYYSESKDPNVIKEELERASKNPLDTKYFGTFDVHVQGKKKEEVCYSMIEDCVGALQASVDFGVKKYKLMFYCKKQLVVSHYKFKKNDTSTGGDLKALSPKDRRKQLL